MDKSHPLFKKTIEFLRKYKNLERKQELLTRAFLEEVDGEVSAEELESLDKLLEDL